MKKRVMALVAAACMLVATVAGCSNKQESTSAPTAGSSSAATTKPTEATTETPTAKYSPDQYSYMLDDNGYITGVTALDYIELPNISEVTFSKSKDFAPTDEEVDYYVYFFMSAKGLLEKVYGREVKKDDLVVIDFVGYMDGKAFEGGTAKDQAVTAGGTGYIDDFLDQIIGHKPGETFDVEVTFPDKYESKPEFQGKDATFSVTIQYIKEYPEFTDQFVLMHQEELKAYFGDHEFLTAQSVKDYISQYISSSNEESVIYEYFYTKVKLKDGAKIPDNALAYAYMSVNLQLLNNYGVGISDLVKDGSYTQDQMDALVVEEAQYGLFVQALAESLGWSWSDDDLKVMLGSNDVDISVYLKAYGKGYMYRQMILYTTEEYLMKTVTITD